MNLMRTNYGIRGGLFSIFFILSSWCLSAQQSFHRIYPAQKEKKVATISSVQIKDGHYVSMHLEVEPGEDESAVFGDSLIITSYNANGDMAWSKSIVLDASYDKVYHSLSSIIQGGNDSIYYSLVADQAGKYVNLIGSLNTGGNLGFLKAYSYSDISKLADGESNLLVNYGQSFFNASTVNEGGRKSIYLSRLNYDGDTLWTRALNIQGQNTQLDLGTFRQTNRNLIATGSLVTTRTNPYILLLDSLGSPILSKMFRDTLSTNTHFTGLDVRQLADSSFVLVGNLIDSSAVNNENKTSGFVIKADKYGNVQWSKKIAFPGDSTTTLNYCTINRNNDLILGGVSLDVEGKDNSFFMVRMRIDGEVVWQKKYVQAEGALNLQGGALYEAIDWGIVLMGTGLNDKGKVGPAFIKTDTDGATGCETDITQDFISNYTLVSDTLIWETRNVFDVNYDDVDPKADFYVFDIPVIGLDIKMFCPNEPIDWTFDATINNASSYLWSDGSTSSTLRVFDEGEYSVTVFMNDNVCYMLSDTAKLERFGAPQASLSLSLGNFCTNGKQTVQMGYGPGHPNIKSISWSTGETDVRSIEIATPGVYSVTVVDACDEVAEQTITVGDFPTPITTATIKDNIIVDCAYGNLSGSLEAQGNSTGLGEETYLWNTGNTNQRLIVEYVETLFYAVTVSDQCGNTATASKIYEIKGENKLNLFIDADETAKCTEGRVRLNAILGTQSNKIKYQWDYKDNQTPSIEITEPGTYRITITDACGNTLTASKTIDFKGSLNLSIIADVDYEELCENGNTQIALKLSPPGTYQYKWSTGEVTPDITVEIGTFIVTITDHCNNNYERAFNIDINDMIFGKIFFPDGTISPNFHPDTAITNSDNYKNAELYNRSFGPVDLGIYCLTQVTDYELYVFNRWGQEVFVSKNITDEWDGTYQGKPAPSEAYVWVVKYKVLGKPKTSKGSVTLIRL